MGMNEFDKEAAYERMQENERSKAEVLAEISEDIFLCEGCEHEAACDSRGEHDPHILEAQYIYCHEVGKPSFEDDDHWIATF